MYFQNINPLQPGVAYPYPLKTTPDCDGLLVLAFSVKCLHPTL